MQANSILKTASTELSAHYQLQLDELQIQYANLLREQYILAKNDNLFDTLDQLSQNSSSLDSHIRACLDKLNRESMSTPGITTQNFTDIPNSTTPRQALEHYTRNHSFATLESLNKFQTGILVSNRPE